MLQLSVIIPTYKRPAQLRKCLEALSRQTINRDLFEIIIVDDGGQVPLEDLTAEFKDRLSLSLLIQSENKGPAQARNAGAGLARGQFLVFTDDDCLPPPEWLENLGEALRISPNRLIGGRTENALPRNPYSALSQLVLDAVYAHYNSDPKNAFFFASNHMAVPRDRFLEIGGFSPDFRTAEDRDLCERFRMRGLGMTYAPQSVTFHAHELTMLGLWRQHFQYGQGAFHFYRVRVREGGSPLRPDPCFYRSLFLAPIRAYRGMQRLQMMFLLFFQQVANAAGYVLERVRRSRAA